MPRLTLTIGFAYEVDSADAAVLRAYGDNRLEELRNVLRKANEDGDWTAPKSVIQHDALVEPLENEDSDALAAQFLETSGDDDFVTIGTVYEDGSGSLLRVIENPVAGIYSGPVSVDPVNGPVVSE